MFLSVWDVLAIAVAGVLVAAFLMYVILVD